MSPDDENQGPLPADAPAIQQQQHVGSIHFGSGSDNRVILQINAAGARGEGRSAGSPEDDAEKVSPEEAPLSALATGWKWFLGIATGLITLVVLPLLNSLLTGQNPLPTPLQKIVPYSAHLITGSVAMLALLYLWQSRRGQSPAETRRHGRSDKIEIPSRATLLVKSNNVLNAGEMEFEHAVDVALGIHQVPQLVHAQHLPHTGSRGAVQERPLTEPLLDYLLRVERLLIVGVPGAGKTQTLRILWGQLLNRAQDDASLPVPFLVNLTTFSKYQGPLRTWLAQSLRECAGMHVAIWQALLQRGQLFLLLDGLDEMAAERRAIALTELNEMLRVADPALNRCVVCSRTLEYQQAGVPLLLPTALELQPLIAKDVQNAVAQAGPSMEPLAAALARDAALAELLATPLLLTIATRAFAGIRSLEVAGHGPAEIRRALYDAYVVQMLRRSTPPIHEMVLTLRWFRWLAQYLRREQVNLFLIEWLQPSALATNWKYRLVFGVFGGLVGGLFGGLVFGLLGRLGSGLVGESIGELIGRFVGGLFGGLIFGLYAWKLATGIYLGEQLRWSWAQARTPWRSGLKFGLVFGVVSGFVTGLVFGLAFGLVFGLGLGRGLVGGLIGAEIFGLICGLFGGVVFGLGGALTAIISGGWVKKFNVLPTYPNEGARASSHNGILEGLLVVGLGIPLVVGLVFGLHGKLGIQLGAVMGAALGAGLLVVMMGGGLGEAMKHYLLRLFLWREGHLPLRLVPWLEGGRSCLLLRRHGGAYLFWHTTLQDHFASLDDDRLATLAQRIEIKEFYQPRY